MTDRIGTLEDVGKSVCVCDVCDYVAWDGGRDGDPCRECEARNEDCRRIVETSRQHKENAE